MVHFILDTYCAASDQIINLDKSMLNIKEADNPRKYLGLPSIWNISKKEALGYIKERILKLIHGWSNKELSLAGKEVLLKFVATAISAYPITCFKLPITLCNEINMVMASFWWGDNVSRRKVPWNKWAGLGETLLAKQCWRILNNPQALWVRILKSLYFLNCDVLEAERGGKASWASNSLLEGRDVILSGARWQILGHNSIRLWEDSWLSQSTQRYLCPIALVPSSGPRMVANIIDWEHKT
ncbi:unnamed protein product [Prunus armeniaca]